MDKCYECKHHRRLQFGDLLLNPGYCQAVPRDDITGDMFTCKEVRSQPIVPSSGCFMWEPIPKRVPVKRWWHWRKA